MLRSSFIVIAQNATTNHSDTGTNLLDLLDVFAPSEMTVSSNTQNATGFSSDLFGTKNGFGAPIIQPAPQPSVLDFNFVNDSGPGLTNQGQLTYFFLLFHNCQ